jgi:hypothetical protein
MSEQSPVTFETVRQFALALPGVEEGTSYGTPAFRVQKKLLARLHDDRETLVLRTDYGEREYRMLTNPAAFYITDHYAGSSMMLVRLDHVDPDDLRDLITQAWRACSRASP